MLITGVFVFVIAAGMRLANFENEPITDELYHLIAAASWAQDGDFAVADGEYARGSLFTMLVGAVHLAGNGDVNTIRIVCILIGALLVATVAAWTARYAGVPAGIIAGVLLAVLPTAIFLAQYIRFYSLHALLFFLLAWCVWDLRHNADSRRRWVVGVAAVIFLLLGLHLQVTTLVGVAGLALWLLIEYRHALQDALPKRSHRWAAAVGSIAVVATLALVFQRTIAELLGLYTASALWNSSDTPLYYFNLYRHDFGLFWSLAPAAFIIALIVRPSAALLCTCVFLVAFVVQSFGGMRAERFMFYALPFFFVVWGIAIDAVARSLYRWLTQALTGHGSSAAQRLVARWLPSAVVVGAGLFALLTTPFVEVSAKMALGKPLDPVDYWDRYRTNWQRAAPQLKSVIRHGDVVIASQPLHAIYYLGDVDYELNATMLADIAPAGVHALVDPRTERTVFDDVDTLRRIIACHESGSIVVHAPAFGNPSRVGEAVAKYIEDNLERVDIGAHTDMLVFRWQTAATDDDCRLRDGRWIPDER